MSSDKANTEFYELLTPNAENIKPEVLDKLPIDIYVTRSVYNSILEGVEKLSKGYVISYPWIEVVGYYGSGKTFVLRKAAHDAVNRYDNIISIYFYLGEKNAINLFSSLGKYIQVVKEYVDSAGKIVSSKNVGSVDVWKKKIDVLSKVYTKVQQDMQNKESEITKFVEVMKQLNREGYFPLIIFDEMERLILTGEGFESDASYLSFIEFSKYSLEMTRGHLFRGIGVFGLTMHITELLDRASKERELRVHVRRLEDLMGRSIYQLDIGSPSITSAMIIHMLKWDARALEMLCKNLGIVLPLEIVEMLEKVLPTPRAVIQIYSKVKSLGAKSIGREDIYKLIVENRWRELRPKLAEAKVDNKPLITGQSRWDEYFEKLIENNMYVLNLRIADEYKKIASVLGIQAENEKILKNRIRNVINLLESYGMIERIEKNTYAVSRYLFAYFLNIDRLPGGELTTEDAIIQMIKNRVKELRERRRKAQRRVEEKT